MGSLQWVICYVYVGPCCFMESPNQPQPRVAVSYAWKAEDERYPLVKQLCAQLKTEGINVFWDERLKPDDNLDEFYTSLAKSEVLIAVISDDYFESENCMLNELLPAFRDVGYNRDRFERKVIFLIHDSAEELLRVSATDSFHPFKQIRTTWEERLKKEEQVTKNGSESPLAEDIRDLLSNHRGIMAIRAAICSRMTLRGEELIRLDDYVGVLKLVQKRIRKWQEDRQRSNPIPSAQDEKEGYITRLRNRPITGLETPEEVSQPTQSKSKRPKSLSFSLMLILQESGERNRYMLTPELHVSSPRKADLNPDEWPDALKMVQENLQHIDNVEVNKTGKIIVVKPKLPGAGRNREPLGEQLKTWLDIVKSAATKLNQRCRNIQPEVVELVVPKTLLHHDFGASLLVPITTNPMPLASHECFMMRSLERAIVHRTHGQTPLQKKWQGSAKDLLVVHLYEDNQTNWHDDLFQKTQLENVRYCVVLQTLSSTPKSRDKIVNYLVDSFLPLVVFWPGNSNSTDSASRLQYVYDLLSASRVSASPADPPPDPAATAANNNWYELHPLEHKQPDMKIEDIAKKRKDLNHQSAVLLMDHPERWPRCVNSRLAAYKSPTVS